MPNRMLTREEVGQMMLDEIKEACGDDIKKQRAYVYDLQTALGGFPASKEERERYIETGHS